MLGYLQLPWLKWGWKEATLCQVGWLSGQILGSRDFFGNLDGGSSILVLSIVLSVFGLGSRIILLGEAFEAKIKLAARLVENNTRRRFLATQLLTNLFEIDLVHVSIH